VSARWLPAVAHWVHLDWVLLVVAAWLLIGVAGIFALRRLRLVARVLFPIGGACGLLLFGVAAECERRSRPRSPCCRSACRSCPSIFASTACRRSS
jgi:hypothetical protein